MALIVTQLGRAIYINNPIVIDFRENTPDITVVRYELRITNASTQFAQTFRFSPNLDGTLKIDISPLIKSMFKKPKHNEGVGPIDNSAREVFNLNFTCLFNTPTENNRTSTAISNNKVFFRGGIRGQKFNVLVISDGILRSSDKLPVWPGYPTLEYSVGDNYNITQSIPGPLSNTEQMKVKGCNPVYLKYLNSKGGYSNWLFEGQNETMDTTNSGHSNSIFGIVDFGNETDFEVELYSKVPARYHGLMLDLIDSPEIYIFSGGEYIRVINSNNKMERGNFKKVYEVKFNFKRLTNYNAQTLWQ